MTPAPQPPSSRQASRLRTAVPAVVVLLVGVLSALAVFFWVHTEQAAVEQYNRSALALARLGAQRIEDTMELLGSRLRTLSLAPCDQAPDSDACTQPARSLLAEFEPLGAIDVLHLDPAGQVSESLELDRKRAQALVDQALTACPPEALPCLGFALDPHSDHHTLAVVAQINQPARSNQHAAAVFEWTRLAGQLTHAVALDPDGLAWLLDQTGRLVFHPDSPEVCNEKTPRQDARCQVCHRDSALHERMRLGKTGVGTLGIAGLEPKLVAFTPLRINHQAWSLAVAVPYTAVVQENRRVLLVAILISALLIGLFLVVTFFLDQENLRQIQTLSDNQATIRQLNADLETKVRERTAQLRQVYDEISEFRRGHETRERLAIVGELAAVVAHEIRNPLNALAINSERLLRKLRPEAAVDLEQTRQMVEAQLFEVRRINEFIEQYLRLARLPQQRKQRADLNGLVGDLLKFLAVEGKRLDVRLEHQPSDEPLMAVIDEEQIRQVLLNLMVNSFQAMPTGGELVVTTANEDDQAVIRIRDTGVGIASDKLTDVFKPFFTTREGGTGLGLAISARFVKEHRGELSCQSEVGRGTTFTIRIPIEQLEGD